jgi:hypothetical protein
MINAIFTESASSQMNLILNFMCYFLKANVRSNLDAYLGVLLVSFFCVLWTKYIVTCQCIVRQRLENTQQYEECL